MEIKSEISHIKIWCCYTRRIWDVLQDVQTKSPKIVWERSKFIKRREFHCVKLADEFLPKNQFFVEFDIHKAFLSPVWYTNPIKVSSMHQVSLERGHKTTKLQFWISVCATSDEEATESERSIRISVSTSQKAPHDHLSTTHSRSQHVLLLQITYRSVHPESFLCVAPRPHLHECEVWSECMVN